MTFEFGLMCEMEELLKLVIITVVKMLFIQIQTMVGWIQHFTSLILILILQLIRKCKLPVEVGLMLEIT